MAAALPDKKPSPEDHIQGVWFPAKLCLAMQCGCNKSLTAVWFNVSVAAATVFLRLICTIGVAAIFYVTFFGGATTCGWYEL